MVIEEETLTGYKNFIGNLAKTKSTSIYTSKVPEIGPTVIGFLFEEIKTPEPKHLRIVARDLTKIVEGENNLRDAIYQAIAENDKPEISLILSEESSRDMEIYQLLFDFYLEEKNKAKQNVSYKPRVTIRFLRKDKNPNISNLFLSSIRRTNVNNFVTVSNGFRIEYDSGKAEYSFNHEKKSKKLNKMFDELLSDTYSQALESIGESAGESGKGNIGESSAIEPKNGHVEEVRSGQEITKVNLDMGSSSQIQEYKP